MTAADLHRGEAPEDVAKPGDGDQKFWSVTTIIGALDKPALVPWAAKMTAERAVKVARSLPTRIAEDGEPEVVKWLTGARFARPVGTKYTAAELGTAVHAACEHLALTGERPDHLLDDEVRPIYEQFEAWCQRWQPEYLAAEMTVYSPTWGYAGTQDAVMKVGGLILGVDYKTKREPDTPRKVHGPYPDVALQLAAYRYAELAAVWRPRRWEQRSRRYYLLGPDEREMAVPVPEVDGGLVIHLSPSHCNAYPVRCGPAVHEAFLHVMEAARWSFESSTTAIGERLVHPEEAP